MNYLLAQSALAFPNINPVIVEVGPIKIHWYGVGYVVGILFSWWYGCRLLKKPYLWFNAQSPLSTEKLNDFVVWAAIGVVVGGRLGQVLLWNPAYYASHPLEIVAIWDGGMAFHGGFVGVIIAMVLFALKHNIRIWSMFDLIAAGAPFGLGIVRICNFINSELWGNVSNVPWAVLFPNGGVDVNGNLLPRHPSQLYEAAMEGLILFILLMVLIFVFKALRRPGMISGAFVLGYGISRIIGEFFRVPTEDPDWFTAIFNHSWFTYGMALSLPMVIFGLFAISRALVIYRPNSSIAEQV